MPRQGCTKTLIRSNKALMCLELGRECGLGPKWDPAAEGGDGIPRNGPSHLRRDSADPGGRSYPSHPLQPEPCAINANTTSPTPNTACWLLAVGWAMGLWG